VVDVRREWNVSRSLDAAYGQTMDALHYASLLARHAGAALPHLSDEPGVPSFSLDFRTDNPEVPRLAKTQFGDEVSRYALVYALAHYDRFVLDLAVMDAIVTAVAERGGEIAAADALEIETSVRTVRRNRSVAVELRRLGGTENEGIATGITWFRGLYDVRNCLVHRAGIVSTQDKRLLDGITWRRFALAHNGDVLTGTLPQVVPAGTITLQLLESGRSWKLGERITLSLEELQQMMFSLYQLAASLVQHLNADFTARLGLESPPP